MTAQLPRALLPCPFCGDHRTYAQSGQVFDQTYLMCDNCGAVTSFRPKKKHAEAIAAYNCRSAAGADLPTDAASNEGVK